MEALRQHFDVKISNPKDFIGLDIHQQIAGRTDKKVCSLMWTTMGIRYDITYSVKELSRVLQEPTKIVREILERTLQYVTQTKEAFIAFNPEELLNY